MESSFAFFTIFSLVLIGNTMAARKDPSEVWKDATEGQPMPKAIQGLLPAQKPNGQTDTDQTSNKLEQSYEVLKNFKPEHGFLSYGYQKLGGDKSLTKEYEVLKNFKPELSFLTYGYQKLGGDKSLTKEYEVLKKVGGDKSLTKELIQFQA